MKERIVWIDWAKTILIYLMVVGHCFPVAWENQLIYAFHMPAFFIISGYLYHPHKWSQTLRSFLVPILFFSLVNFLIYALPKLLKGTFSTIHLAERVLVPFWGPGSLQDEEYIYLFPGVWFIIVLMLSRLLIGDIKLFRFILKYKWFVICILLSFLILEPFVWPDNPLHEYKLFLVIPSMPFILLGYSFKGMLHLEKIKLLTIVISSILFVIVSILNGRTGIHGYKWGVSYGLFFVNSIIGSMILFFFCTYCKYNQVIVVLSKGTLLIMAFNFVLKSAFIVLFEKISLGCLTEDHYIYPWVVGLLILFVCYWPIKWLLQYCPQLLGK